jgi:hypothetical protein
MRRALHRNLDSILNTDTTMPDGSASSVLDDLIVRHLLHGCGVAVRLAAVPPDVVEAPAPQPLI